MGCIASTPRGVDIGDIRVAAGERGGPPLEAGHPEKTLLVSRSFLRRRRSGERPPSNDQDWNLDTADKDDDGTFGWAQEGGEAGGRIIGSSNLRMAKVLFDTQPDWAEAFAPDFDPMDAAEVAMGNRRLLLVVEREQLLQSVLHQVLMASPSMLRPGRLRVQYAGEDGEDGEGGAGITRAFLSHTGELLADRSLGLLLPAPGGHLQLGVLPGYVARRLRIRRPRLAGTEGAADDVFRHPDRWSRFLGRMLGMALVHECPLGLRLVPSLCKQLLGQEPSFEDLRFAPGLSDDGGNGWYTSLRALLAHRAPNMVEDQTLPCLAESDVDEALAGQRAAVPSRAAQTAAAQAIGQDGTNSEAIDFTEAQSPVATPAIRRDVSDVSGPGISRGEALCASNIEAFAAAVTAKALTQNLQPHLASLLEEFRKVVPRSVARGLTWQQVQDRISGKQLDPKDFVTEWRRRTVYTACDDSDRSVQLWWNYMGSLSSEELRKAFTWCTNYASIPATPWKFQIMMVDDTSKCPTVNTCMTDDPSVANRGVKMPTLYLPAYRSKDVLAHKMDWALQGATAICLH